MPTTEPVPVWHALSPAAALEQLGVSGAGLSTSEARTRQQQFGPNALRVVKPVSALRILINQLRSVVVLLLLAAAVVTWLFGDVIEAVAILGVLVINAGIGFGTELRARTAMAALLRLEVPTARVLRDGVVQDIRSTELVPGDVIQLEAGSAVPADARLLASTELRTNEAPLTGESMPVDKRAESVLATDTPLAERVNAVYMSTAVVAGTGRALVTATGMQTEVGRIGTLVGGITAERTPLEHRLDRLGQRLIWITLAVGLLVVGLGLWRGEPFSELLRTGIALAIAAVPEGLPAVSTIALAVGVARMARRKALVRRLPAVEALGSVTTVCTDKTGTLTAGEMSANNVWAGGQSFEITGTGYEPVGAFTSAGQDIDVAAHAALELALRIGALANRATLTQQGDQWSIEGDPTEAALLVAAGKAGLERARLHEQWPEIGELPFSSERMLMATFHKTPDGEIAYIKGAPDRVLALSDRVLTAAGPVTLDDAGRERVLAQNRAMAARGLRVLGLATAEPPRTQGDELRTGTFVGLVGLSDPPAPGVHETLARLDTAGIRILMITGDQRLTAVAVAEALGLRRPGGVVIDGQELQHIEAARLGERLRNVVALSRVSPEDKLRIVEALQHRGEVVAMIGDGVNDAAALKKADIGVAMGGRGTDVAKEAASVVLQDDRFQTIGAAIEEGRVIFDNIRKFVFYLFSCNLAEVLVLVAAGVAGLPQPLLPLQILWLNLVTDTFPALSLAVEPAEPHVMQRPPYDPRAGILSRPMMRALGFYALLITVVTLGAFLWALHTRPGDSAYAVTVAFMTLALAQTFHLGNARSAGPVVAWRRMFANRWAVAAVATTIALLCSALYYAPLAALLGVVPLVATDWLIILPIAIVPGVVGQALAMRKAPPVASA